MPDDTDFKFGANESEPSIYDGCMGSVKCTYCGKFHGYCREVAEDKEKAKMLPTGNETPSGGRSKRQGGMDWIKNEDLSLQPKEAKILMVRYNKEGRFGARVEMKLAIEGKIKYWGIPPKIESNSPNYRLLTERFGHDENNWVDQRILLVLEKEDFGEQYFIRVDFPPKEKPSRSSSTR